MNLDFTKTNVLVVGDVMLDRYWEGSTERVSPEAPVPVVEVSNQSARVGGSGNVAMNIISLGASASLYALIGEDDAGNELARLLEYSNIKNQCSIKPDFSTITKLRVLSQHQQLIRLDFEQKQQSSSTDSLLQCFEKSVAASNIVVLSDYNKGVLDDAISFIEVANKNSKPVLVDPKKDSFQFYKGAYLLTPNKKEFEAVVGPWNDEAEMISKAGRIIEECDLSALLVTQGAQGMTLIMKDQTSEHFEAQAKDVYDVTGAGDTVIASIAVGLGSGMSIEESVYLSCKASGIVVGRVGTSSVTVDDLKKVDDPEYKKCIPLMEKIVDQKTLQGYLNDFKKNDEVIVFTNGCFDLLHTGHVRYLEHAASMGDRLIVAVNSDSSVTKLKGSGRPINKLHDRMEILAGLSSVDFVVDFSEDTPEDLICAIQPDILVKGADYKVEQVAGRECAGRVELISLVEGRSSSSTLKKINEIK